MNNLNSAKPATFFTKSNLVYKNFSEGITCKIGFRKSMKTYKNNLLNIKYSVKHCYWFLGIHYGETSY